MNSFNHPILGLLIVLSACSSESTRSDPRGTLKLYALDCGTVTAHDISVFNPDLTRGEERTLANACFFIEHPKGTLLWDTGNSDRLLATESKSERVNDSFTLHAGAGLENQLRRIGYAPAQIDYLAFSHLHLDHGGNALTFDRSSWLMHRAEFEQAQHMDAAELGYRQEDYLALLHSRAQTHTGDLDVFGDGTVQLFHTPGHSPGHQVLMVELGETGAVLISGDLYHFQENYDKQGIPIWNDPVATRASFGRVEQLMDRHDAQLWIQHDYDRFRSLRLAPEHYQ